MSHISKNFVRCRVNCRYMKSSHVCGSACGPCISRICPSMNAAVGWNGGLRVNACGRSSLKEVSHEESMVMVSACLSLLKRNIRWVRAAALKRTLFSWVSDLRTSCRAGISNYADHPDGTYSNGVLRLKLSCGHGSAFWPHVLFHMPK